MFLFCHIVLFLVIVSIFLFVAVISGVVYECFFAQSPSSDSAETSHLPAKDLGGMSHWLPYTDLTFDSTIITTTPAEETSKKPTVVPTALTTGFLDLTIDDNSSFLKGKPKKKVKATKKKAPKRKPSKKKK